MTVEPRKRFKRVPTYKMVLEEFAKSQANNHGLTLRERLWWLAMWRAKANGHATFQDGEIANILTVRQRDGRITPPSRWAISKARADAVAAGQLHPMSDANCLVLSTNAVTSRRNGWDKPCPYCMKFTPEPSTTIALRDYESESIDRESYGRGMKSQAGAVLAQPTVAPAATNSCTARDEEEVLA